MKRRATPTLQILFVSCTMIAASTLIATRANALEIKRMTLSNGAVLLVSEEHQLPMVTVAIALDAGARHDPEGKAGLATLTAESVHQGTKELSAAELNQKIDFMGSSLSVGAEHDYATASFTSLKKYEKDTLALLAGLLTAPGLRDADIERKRAEQVAQIKAQEEEPGYIGGVAFAKGLYGNTPYGQPAGGSAESVSKLTSADVRDFYRDYYKLGSAIIAVTGDVTADEVKALLEQELSGPKGDVPVQPEPVVSPLAKGLNVKLIDRNVQQANVMLGFVGIARSNPDFYKVQVMNYILGGGMFASRLMKVVRSKAGLAYHVASIFDARKFPGPFAVVLQTKNKSANEAIKLVLQQMREIQEAPVSDDEINNAKKFLIGSFPLKIDRQSQIAGFMLQIELDGLGLDYADKYPQLIQAVTKQDVLDVARKYLHPDDALLVAVADQHEAAINTTMLSDAAAGTAGGK
ncbi:MAG: M16 family metallopeptidase [Candidatus Binataceae bacterium]